MATPQHQITFYDNYKAPLPAGLYRLVLQQTVTVGHDQPRHYYRDQRFEVAGPQYAIEADDIQAYFPPAGGVADYNFVLPHLVLNSRNLPWERTLSSDSEDPWLALLVVSEREIIDTDVVFKRGTVADLKPFLPDHFSGNDEDIRIWWRPDANGSVLLPRFPRTDDANTPVGLLDLNLDLFLKLCPTRKELPLLAHIRHVATDDKVPLAMVADGEFSVVVAKRFPPLGANTVYLISLEGWRYVLDAPDEPQPHSRVRLITLGSWTFVNDPTGNDTFGGLMQRLKTNSAVFGITVPTNSGSSYVDQALKRGYVPLDFKPRESSANFAWYRGPLAPLKREQVSVHAFERADAALVLDPNRGIMDVSYACAWELGRLSALSSPAFVKGLRLFVEQTQTVSEFTKEIEKFVESHRSSFTEPITGDKKPHERIVIADELIEWIARLVLLYPVPFHYLVPHQSLLPPESLRFFHLDDNWVDALLDGALSIAIGDVATERKGSRAEMHSALSRIVYQHRLRLQGKNPEWQPSESYMSTAKSGFLLRSRVVTGWPGLEVTAKTSTAHDATLPNILRFEQIADGVLFCLARGIVEEVRFREPREGITFGVGSNGKIKTKSGGFLDVKTDYLRSGSVGGVVDITKLQGALASAGSADFATQMILKPEEQTITWSNPR